MNEGAIADGNDGEKPYIVDACNTAKAATGVIFILL